MTFGFLSRWVAFALEALAVDDGRTALVVFLLADPHLLESGQRGQDGAADPDRVFALRGRDDLDLHGRRGQGRDLLLHTIGDTGVHGGAAGQDGVGVQVLTDIDVAFHDRVVRGFVNTARFHTQERGLEQGFRATETFVTNGDDLTIGQFVALLQRRAAGGGGHLLFEVQGDIAQFFFDIADDFTFGRGGERVTTLSEDLH